MTVSVGRQNMEALVSRDTQRRRLLRLTADGRAGGDRATRIAEGRQSVDIDPILGVCSDYLPRVRSPLCHICLQPESAHPSDNNVRYWTAWLLFAIDLEFRFPLSGTAPSPNRARVAVFGGILARDRVDPAPPLLSAAAPSGCCG
jgi:hypothetical protein